MTNKNTANNTSLLYVLANARSLKKEARKITRKSLLIRTRSNCTNLDSSKQASNLAIVKRGSQVHI